MSASAILTAATNVLVAACPTVKEIYPYAPPQLNDIRTIFLWHDTYTDSERVAGGIVRRTHHIPIWLLVLASQVVEPTAAENDFLIIAEQIANAFYGNHTLQNTCKSCDLIPQTGPNYIDFMGATYRHRLWVLDAMEDLQLTFA